MTQYVYFLGSTDGRYVKVGETANGLVQRQADVEKEYQTELLFLAAVVGTRPNEKWITNSVWRPYSAQGEFIRREEVFHATREVSGYIAWLRRQWYATVEPTEPIEDAVDFSFWSPERPERVWFPDPEGDGQLFQRDRFLPSSLHGTAWAWMVPQVDAEDWYTNVALFRELDRVVGFDLDAASHPIANRVLRVPDIFEVRYSALRHPWYGNVWLAPPGGKRQAWFDRALEQWDAGNVRSLTLYLPDWAVGLKTITSSRTILERADLVAMLNPPPPFWGPSSGRRVPWFIVHLGPYAIGLSEVLAEFGASALRPYIREGAGI